MGILGYAFWDRMEWICKGRFFFFNLTFRYLSLKFLLGLISFFLGWDETEMGWMDEIPLQGKIFLTFAYSLIDCRVSLMLGRKWRMKMILFCFLILSFFDVVEDRGRKKAFLY